MTPSDNRRTTDSPARRLATLTITAIAFSLCLGNTSDGAQADDRAPLSYASTAAPDSARVEPALFIPPLNCRPITPRLVYLPSVIDNANTVSYGTLFSHSTLFSYETVLLDRNAISTQRLGASSRLRRLPPVPIVCAPQTAVRD